MDQLSILTMPSRDKPISVRVKLADGSAIERDYRINNGIREPYGNWKWSVYDPTRRPRIKRITLRTRDKGAALQKASEYVKLRASGGLDPWNDAAPQDGVTIEEAATDFLRDKTASGASPATVETDRGHIERLSRALGPVFLVGHVEPRHVEAFLTGLGKKGHVVSGAYRSRVRASIRHFFEWAVGRGYMKSNPAADVKGGSGPKGRRNHLDAKEAESLVGEIRKAHPGDGPGWLEDWVVFGVGTGLRPAEMRALTWAAVSLTERTVRVGVGHRTKTAKSARAVPVRGDALAVLQRRFGDGKKPSDLVFTGDGGGPVATDYVTKRIKKLAESAEIARPIVGYSLRHGYGTRMAQAGVPLFELAQIMGTSVKMIEDHYGHHDPSRAAAHVDRVFGAPGV